MSSSDEVISIPVTRQVIHYRGQLRPFRDHYYCTGPDGRRFDNSSLATLRQVLRRRYGKVDLQLQQNKETDPEGSSTDG